MLPTMQPQPSPDPQPHVLIVGGLLTPPVGYRGLRRRLLDRGAAAVEVAPISVLDWARAGIAGFGALQRTVARAIDRTRSGAGVPIMVIGHSGGGLLARLAMSDAPYRGHVGGAAPKVG
jgi:alpha-beta hydrolase superfamily lysophospholipase